MHQWLGDGNSPVLFCFPLFARRWIARDPFSGCNFPNFQQAAPYSVYIAMHFAWHTKNNLSLFQCARLGGEFTSQLLAVSAAFTVLCFFNLVPCLVFEVARAVKTHHCNALQAQSFLPGINWWLCCLNHFCQWKEENREVQKHPIYYRKMSCACAKYQRRQKCSYFEIFRKGYRICNVFPLKYC